MINLSMADLFEKMKADYLLILDYPTRKVGVVANTSGQVLVAIKDGDVETTFVLEADEITAISIALVKAGQQATDVMNVLSADFQANELIQRASGCARQVGGAL